MKRVMVVGQTGAGKTSLLKALGVWEGRVRKTEALAYGPQCIDTPGEFFDIPMFYHVLIQTSIKAAVIIDAGYKNHIGLLPGCEKIGVDPGKADAINHITRRLKNFFQQQFQHTKTTDHRNN